MIPCRSSETVRIVGGGGGVFYNLPGGHWDITGVPWNSLSIVNAEIGYSMSVYFMYVSASNLQYLLLDVFMCPMFCRFYLGVRFNVISLY